MKIIQFAFDSGEGNDHLPKHYHSHSVLYTGTHDNDTVKGWFKNATPQDQARARRELRIHEPIETIHWGFIRAALQMVPALAILPLQDILGLDSEARFNTPGTLGNNWRWRFGPQDLSSALATQLGHLVRRSGR
jgi:4-alpha-glucanotransferase